MLAEEQQPDAAVRKPSNLVMRVLTAVLVAPLLLLLVFEGPWWGFSLLVGVAACIASWELMVMTMPRQPFLHACGIAVTLALFVTATFGTSTAAIVTAMLLVVIGSLLVALTKPEVSVASSNHIAWLMAAPLYVAVLLAPLAQLHLRPHGGGWVLLGMMLAWFGDTAAYFTGRAFGKRKLYQSISPTKTMEGALGGLVGSLLGALLAHYWYLPVLPLSHAVILGVTAGALGQAGDLCESMVKRSTGVKDSGRLVPGHGGLLDRIDALMFTSAATWVYVHWFMPA
jgi:phosphatidate cytidylyltransferase